MGNLIVNKLKILFVNNYYYLRGGSERVLFEEAALLEKYGNTIIFLSTDENIKENTNALLIPKLEYSIKNIPRFIYSRVSRREIKNQILREKPDIIHAHNIYGAISPSILPEARANEVPVALTLHDYKLLCPTYLFMRNGCVCEECKGGKYYRAIINRCKGGSLLSSTIVALEAYIHKLTGIWKNNVDAYIAPSEFMRNKMIEYGWEHKSIYIVPNFLPLEKYEPEFRLGNYLLYMGRLSEEKGVDTLIEAFSNLDTDKELLIAGDGPLGDEYKVRTKNNSKIKYVGHLGGDELESLIKNSMCLIVPSICYENASMAILEAMAYGKPVIGAKIGGIPEMVSHRESGLLFESGNAEDLRSKLKELLSMPEADIENMGRVARRHIESKHSSENHYKLLMSVYDAILK